jgi:hypothetical protein
VKDGAQLVNENAVKKFSIGFMIIFASMAIVALIVVTLFSAWSTFSKPESYVITDVTKNARVMLPNCDEPVITSLQNITTGQIVYKCGALGTISEIVTLYE